MKTVVFAGPSLYGVDRGPFDRIEFRPPAACGDILRSVDDGATAIGLIDGYYGDQVAVWHKEILFALSRGIQIAGAASMGALRAAECASFGMRGFGAIYADYASGLRTSDADVAISHAPEEMNFMPTSVALVDLEATLQIVATELSLDEYSHMLEAGRRLHFSKRTWAVVAREAGVSSARLQDIVSRERSVKREDAVHLLDVLQNQPAGITGEAPVWQFQKTAFFDRLLASVPSQSDR